MMGAKKSGVSEFNSLLELVDLLEDKVKYSAKIQELDGKISRAESVLAQASENNKTAEDRRALAQLMLEQASQKVAEANAIRTKNDGDTADLIRRETELAERIETHRKHISDTKAALAEDKRRHTASIEEVRKTAAEAARTENAQITAARAELDTLTATLKVKAAELKKDQDQLSKNWADYNAQREALVRDRAEHEAKLEQLQNLIKR